MSVYTFLSALPGILGLVGLFVYLWAGQSRIGGDIVKSIVDKLRKEPNFDINKYGSLSPAKIEKLLLSDATIRGAVNDQDIRLLHSIVRWQHAVTIIVALLSVGLVVWSGWQMTRPRPLSVSPNSPMQPAAGGVLVDLDPLVVQWTSTGPDQMVSVSLENVDTHTRSTKHTVNSSVKSVEFTADEVMAVAGNRSYKGQNRIRTIIEWPGDTAFSETVNLRVGITAQLNLFGRLIGADGTDRTIHTLFALIDNSTERLPSDYCFTANFVYTTSTGPAVEPLRSCHPQGEVMIAGIDRIRWDKPYGLVYTGPDDAKIVRTAVIGTPAK